jgi:hypothetical protein
MAASATGVIDSGYFGINGGLAKTYPYPPGLSIGSGIQVTLGGNATVRVTTHYFKATGIWG